MCILLSVDLVNFITSVESGQIPIQTGLALCIEVLDI